MLGPLSAGETDAGELMAEQIEKYVHAGWKLWVFLFAFDCAYFNGWLHWLVYSGVDLKKCAELKRFCFYSWLFFWPTARCLEAEQERVRRLAEIGFATMPDLQDDDTRSVHLAFHLLAQSNGRGRVSVDS